MTDEKTAGTVAGRIFGPWPLARLIEPFPISDFLHRYWEVRPLHIARSDSCYFRSAFGRWDRSSFLTSAATTHRAGFEAIRYGELLPEIASSVGTDANSYLAAYDLGATIRVNDVEKCWPALAKTCRQLEQILTYPVKANLYCTPKGNAGLNAHFDRHDVLVLQIGGTKRWRVFHDRIESALARLPLLPFESRIQVVERFDRLNYVEARKSLSHDITLKVGDALYIPKGFVHEAWTEEESSDHITLGFHPISVSDLIAVSVREAALEMQGLWRSVNLNGSTTAWTNAAPTPDDIFRWISENVNFRELGASIARNFVRSRARPSRASGQKPKIRLHGASLLCKEDEAIWIVQAAEESMRIIYDNKTMTCPAETEEALRFILSTEHFTPSALPGPLTANAKVVLARTLVNANLVRPAERTE
jgi:hypothetical protein